MTRALGGVLVMLVVATAVAGCGDSGADAGAAAPSRPQATTTTPAPATPVNAVAQARAALVRLADVPDGWTEREGVVTRLRCDGFDPFAGATTVVSSPRLSQEGSGVQERIALYRTADAARRGLLRLDSRRAVNCLRRELQRHVSEESGGPADPSRLTRIERLGPASHARRYVSTAIGNYGKVIGYIDALHARVGRAVAALAIVAGPSPPEEPLYEHVVRLFGTRLNAQLG